MFSLRIALVSASILIAALHQPAFAKTPPASGSAAGWPTEAEILAIIDDSVSFYDLGSAAEKREDWPKACEWYKESYKLLFTATEKARAFFSVGGSMNREEADVLDELFFASEERWEQYQAACIKAKKTGG